MLGDMPSRLAAKVALISGGARGIGAAIARLFAHEGARVMIGDLLDAEGRLVEAEIAAKGGEAVFVHLDVTSEADWERAVAAATSRFGRLDVLVNNAGVGVGAAAGEHRTKYVDMQLDVNLRAIILFYGECAEMLRAAGAEYRGALVVNMSSVSGKAGQPWLSVYSATKAAVIGWTQG